MLNPNDEGADVLARPAAHEPQNIVASRLNFRPLVPHSEIEASDGGSLEYY